MKNTFKTFILLPAFLCVLANAQTNAPSSDDYGSKTYKFTLENLPLDMLLEHYYCSISGDKTEIAPGVAESFTFASGQRLTRDEAIAYITKELEKKHIHLVRQENGILCAEWIP